MIEPHNQGAVLMACWVRIARKTDATQPAAIICPLLRCIECWLLQILLVNAGHYGILYFVH